MRFMQLMLTGVMLCLLLLAGCITIYSPPQQTSSPQDPLVGEWQMTRVSISPPIPLPEFFVNQMVSDKAIWKITRDSNNLLKITYDGRETWYKTPGISVEKKPTMVSEDMPSHASCTFSSGGSLYIDKIPSVPGIMQRIEQVSITYDDAVRAVLLSNIKLSATITMTIQGKYYGEMETGGMKWKTLDSQRTTITYEGTRK